MLYAIPQTVEGFDPVNIAGMSQFNKSGKVVRPHTVLEVVLPPNAQVTNLGVAQEHPHDQ
jgi:hypothetical protein